MINSISEITQLWDRALRKIDERLGERQIFDSFFANSYINNVQDNTIVVVVSTALARTLLKTKYYDLVSGVINEITESNYRLDFILEGEAKSEKIDYTAPQPKKQQQFFQDAILNTKLTFDNFVVGEFNREASQAALLIASNPGKMFNPLFIYSHSGLGKTHLLHAIGNYIIKERNPNARVLYITANDFVEEYIKFVRGEKDDETLKDYV